MTAPIPLNLAVEDALTEALLMRIFDAIPTAYAIRTIYNRGGSGYLKQNVNGFNNAAKGVPFLLGTDLDRYNCPPDLIRDWLSAPKHHNLLIRVAVRESEAWVLADKQNLAGFLRIQAALIPDDVEALKNPKQRLIELARRSRSRELREDLCPPVNSTRKVGPNYNSRMTAFVLQHWDLNSARQHAPSLARAVDCLVNFSPVYPAVN